MTAAVQMRAESSALLQFAVFRVGEHLCALSIDAVHEISRIVAPTPVHEAPDYVRGIINLRGQIVTVVDLRRKLGLPPPPPGSSQRNLVVKSDQELVGLLVDEVDDIVEVPPRDLLPVPPNLVGEFGNHLGGVYQLEGELALLLALDNVLSDSGPR